MAPEKLRHRNRCRNNELAATGPFDSSVIRHDWRERPQPPVEDWRKMLQPTDRVIEMTKPGPAFLPTQNPELSTTV